LAVLVTGMGGVGVNVGRKFVDEGYEVVFYDLVPRRGIDFLEEVKDRIEFVRGDVLDLPYLLEIVVKHDVEGIIHTAIIYPLTIETPDSVFRIAVEGTKNVLEVARLRDLKVVFLSSEAVYGPQPGLNPMREDDPTPRTWNIEPRWRMATLYVGIKTIGEKLMQTYHHVYGLDTVSIRPCEVFGLAEHTMNRPIPYFLKNALLGTLICFESGAIHAKDYTYARDLAKGIFSAYTSRPLIHRVFNITGGELISLQEVAEAVRQSIPGAEIQLGPGELSAEGETHREVRAHMNSIWPHGPCDITRAREELGYEPTPFKQAIKEYAEYLKRQMA